MSRKRAPIVPIVKTGDDNNPSPADQTHVFHDIFGDSSAVILRNFLTVDECAAYIRLVQGAGLGLCGYHSSIRVTDRLQVDAPVAADALYQRILPFCQAIDRLARQGKMATRDSKQL